MSASEVYRHPRYYAIGYRWNTEAECDFIEACLKAHGPPGAKRPLDSPAVGGVARGRPERARRLGLRPCSGQVPSEVEGRLLDIGCGSGRHMTALAARGYRLAGIDLSPEMIDYVRETAKAGRLDLTASVGDLRCLAVAGTYDAAYCFMDTFRFLLTNDEILSHLCAVAKLLAPGGLYLTDFWVPSRWDLIGDEIHQWEQTQGETTVRVFYLQHPESVDPVAQTFDDELVFEVRENGRTTEIRGGPTRTRLIMPQEFGALVEGSGVFDLAASLGEFDLAKPFTRESLSWRMISVLKKR